MKTLSKLLFIVTIVLLTGCMKDEQSSETVGNGFQVEFLFEKDGVKVYRFYDGRYHYFTTLGETITTHRSGKTNYEENITNKY